jgi:hypothetical protein
VLRKLDAEGEEVELALVDLEHRTDEAYRTRRESLTRKRSPPPSIERIVDVGFELS